MGSQACCNGCQMSPFLNAYRKGSSNVLTFDNRLCFTVAVSALGGAYGDIEEKQFSNYHQQMNETTTAIG